MAILRHLPSCQFSTLILHIGNRSGCKMKFSNRNLPIGKSGSKARPK